MSPKAKAWREQFRRTLRTSEGYQGISLALAKALLEQADKTTGNDKNKLQAEATKILNEMTRTTSSFQRLPARSSAPAREASAEKRATTTMRSRWATRRWP